MCERTYFMKRVVFLGAAAATLVQFTKYDLTALQTLGCEIHMVCNMQNGNLSEAALHEYNQTFPQLHWHDLPFADSAAALRRNHQAYQKLLPLLKELKPDLLHCHGTIAGQYGRRAAQELGIPVFYTAHDFRVFHGCLLAERLYEDFALGEISKDRYKKMSADYEEEQERLKLEIDVIEEWVEQREEMDEGLNAFIALTQKYVDVMELTQTIVNEYIKKIVVFAPDKSSGKRQQKVKIYFNFVDDVEIPVISETITTETTYGRRKTA